MNSLKFLVVTTSLETGRDVVGRFRVRNECSLPRFVAGSVDESENGQQSWWRRLWCKVWPARKLKSPFVADLGADAASHQEASNGQMGSPAVPGESASNALVECGSGAVVADSGMPAPRGAVVQAEFRFEHVKVVCNDLHDADIEIISHPPRKHPKEVAVTAGVLANA